MQDALHGTHNAVLVHCRNGKDRSCFAVYAFLRLVHGLEHSKALWHAQQRVGPQNYPLFDIARQINELVEWVQTNLGADMDAESGMCCWQHGSS